MYIKKVSCLFILYFVVWSNYAQINTTPNRSDEQNSFQRLIELGDSHLENENFELSLSSFLKAEALSTQKNDSIELGILTLKIGGIYLIHKDPNTALSYLLKSASYFNKVKNTSAYDDEKFHCYIAISDIYLSTDRGIQGLKYAHQAKEFIPKDESKLAKQLEIYTLNNLAYIHTKTDNYLEALKYFKKALILENEIDALYDKADTYNGIAIVYAKQNENNKAIEYYNYAKDLYEEFKEKEGIAAVLNNKGISYFDLKNYKESERYLKEAIEISTEENYNDVIAESHLFLGKINLVLGQIDKGKQNFDVAHKLAKEIQSNEVYIQTLLEQAKLSKNKEKQTVPILKEALEIAITTDLPVLEQQIYKAFYSVFKNKKPQQALFYFEKYSKLKDSIYSIRKINQTEALKTEFTYLKLQSDLKNKNTKLALSKEREIASKNNTIWIISLFSILTLFLTITIYKQLKLSKTRKKMWNVNQDLSRLKEEATIKEIEFKNKQITDFAIHISEKNDLLENLKQKIKKLPIINKTTASRINDVIVFINDDITQNKEKVQLYSEIDDKTNSFNHQVSQLYPSLSEKERRIATLLRLGHTSKQISLQLNITPASVDNYRSSLRKKMDIPKKTPLVQFMKNI